jgi:hypothetical protein
LVEGRNAREVLDAFHRWARSKPEWKKVYDTLSLDVYTCMITAFDEMESLKPNVFDAWWLQFNCRFKLGGREIRNMRNLLHLFLTDFHHKKMADALMKPSEIPSQIPQLNSP